MALSSQLLSSRPVETVTYLAHANQALAHLTPLPHACMVVVFSMDGLGAAYISSSGLSLLQPYQRQACISALANYLDKPVNETC